MQTLMNDLRYALRQLRKNPGFTTLAMERTGAPEAVLGCDLRRKRCGEPLQWIPCGRSGRNS